MALGKYTRIRVFSAPYIPRIRTEFRRKAIFCRILPSVNDLFLIKYVFRTLPSINDKSLGENSQR